MAQRKNAQRGRPKLSKAEKARREKARAEGQPVVTNIQRSREIFDSFLPKVSNMARAEFRRAVIDAIVEATGTTPNSAATMYNTCKNEAEDDGRLAPGTVGMRARRGLEVEVNPDTPWVLLQATPVAQYPSRDAAKAAAGPGFRVLSTKQWLNEIGTESESESESDNESDNGSESES